MAKEQDVLNLEFRKKIIKEIRGDENKKRKAEAFQAYEILNKRQKDYIIEALKDEYSDESVDNMRQITSINLAPRIINEKASIYKSAPIREFSENMDESQVETAELYYEKARADVKFKKANVYLKAFLQCAVQVIPRNDIIDLRILAPHQYDVIPSDDDPEKAMVYIINTTPKEVLKAILKSPEKKSKSGNNTHKLKGNLYLNGQNGVNETIADEDDDQLSAMRFVWWTDSYNFVTNGKGELINESEEDGNANPIGTLPFVDVCGEKDFEYWVRKGNNVTQFTIDFGVLLCDAATINRNQGYAQAVVYSKEKPQYIKTGPQHVVWMKKTGDAESDPKFEFVTPNPDMASTLELLETYVRLFLTTEDMDPKTISGKAETQRFNSALERLLAMIEKFDASKDDIEIMRVVETKVFELMVKWHNALYGTDRLTREFQKTKLPDDAYITVQFSGPEMVQTKSEKEDSAIKLKEKGLMDDIDVIMELEGVDEEQAINIWLDREVRKIRIQSMLGERLAEEKLAAIPRHQVIDVNQDGSPESEKQGQDKSQPSESQKGDSLSSEAQKTQEVKDVSLNGAQVSSLIDVIQQVAMGSIPRDTGIEIIMTAYGLDRQKAETIMGQVGKSFTLSADDGQGQAS